MFDIEKEREAFEKWAFQASGGWASFSRDSSGNYWPDKLNLAWAAWQGQAKRMIEDCIMVPINNTTIVAVEKMVEQQVEASGITADVFRLDGEKILNAAVEAARGGNHE